MIFRKANQLDAERCLEIYDSVSNWEAINGKQSCWERGYYPTIETVQSALDCDDLYVLEDDIDGESVIVACGRIHHDQPYYYKSFSWQVEVSDKEVLVLHTFAVDPKFQRLGYGKTFMSYYEKMAFEKGCKVLRLDTIILNQKSQAMYKKLGFQTLNQWEGDPNGVGWTLVFLGLEKLL